MSFLVACLFVFGQVDAARAACQGGTPNGLLEGGEECDDNDSDNNDFCLSNCLEAECGDNIECTAADCGLSSQLAGPEECDTGVLRSDTVANACRTTCEDPSCGDTVTDTGEDCDDGDLDNGDFCLTTCAWAACGDGFQCTDNSGADACANSDDLAGVEGCDDGNNTNTDACPNTCVAATCGDGFVRTGFEACDDGNVNNVDGCANNCTLPFCGNGVVQAGEECDDGNNVNQLDACPNTCQNHECGDGILAIPENCDDGNNVNTDSCKNDCSFPVCGDGVVRTGFEQCDDGNAVNTDGCANNCTLPFCGNGVVQAGEECDDGNLVNALDACPNSCQNHECGDGILAIPENCDDGNNVNTDACKNNCTFAVCGDGVIRAGVEGCDDGNVLNGDACTAACFPSGCGNGFIEAPETCDDAVFGTTPPTPLETGSCDNNCTAASCGDGTTNTTAGEECDDGNVINTDGCANNCTLPFCGNGVVQAGEECDDANLVNALDACPNSCQDHECGDGILAIPENCDDGNNVNTDACKNDCTFNVCGDGVPDSTDEQCDDGDTDNTDGCTVLCVSANCGDGIIQVQDGEECDDGNDAVCVGGGYNNGAVCVKDSDCLGICSGATPNPGEPCTTATVAADCGSLVGCLTAGVVCNDVAGTNNSDEVTNACRSTCQQASCGDGVIDSGEFCEGPSGTNTPCIITDAGGPPSATNCIAATCGDAIVCDAGTCTSGPTGGPEDCDDDNLSNTDGCLNTCAAASCGDTFLQVGVEECDDGPALCLGGYDVGEVCTKHADCRGICAVGTVNPGAPCTQAIDVAACGNPGTCTFLTNNCDLPGNNNDEGMDDCRSDCQLWFCGDNVTDTPENCDDGNLDSSDGCKANCTFNVCGDGEVEDGVEACDEGDVLPDDGCSPTCYVEGCGDGVTQANEDCDPQAIPADPLAPLVPLETAGCDIDCTTALCFDDTTNDAAGEECDDGNAVPDDGCTGCLGVLDECGDGTINQIGTPNEEECDDAGANSDTTPDACREDCTDPICGDEVIDPGFAETCDEGGEEPTCDDDCTAVLCGDSNVNEAAGEECDNGGLNDNSPDKCRASTNHVPPYFFDACDLPKNADGLVDPSIGEICDAGPTGDANCNPEGCSTGADGFFNGFNGGFCQLVKIDTSCVGLVEFESCKRPNQIIKALSLIHGRLTDGEARAVKGELSRSQQRVHNAERRTVRLDARVQDRFCPESVAVQTCMDVLLGEQLLEILQNIDDNLESINP